MTRQIEFRTQKAKIVTRDKPGGGRLLFGYAATFNSPSQDLGGYVEVLAPGCFTKTLKEDDIRAFFNHCYDRLLGRTKSGTLRLCEDDVGLAFENDPPDTTDGKNTHVLVSRGDIDGVSFGFYAIEDEWSPDGKINTVKVAQLIEISPVVFPAYLDGPKVEARSGDRFHSVSPERLARRPLPKPQRSKLTLARARNLIRLDD